MNMNYTYKTTNYLNVVQSSFGKNVANLGRQNLLVSQAPCPFHAVPDKLAIGILSNNSITSGGFSIVKIHMTNRKLTT